MTVAVKQQFAGFSPPHKTAACMKIAHCCNTRKQSKHQKMKTGEFMSALSHAVRAEQINLVTHGELCMPIYYWFIIFCRKLQTANCALSDEGKVEDGMNSLSVCC